MDTYNYKGNYAYQIQDAFLSVLNMDPFTKFTNANQRLELYVLKRCIYCSE